MSIQQTTQNYEILVRFNENGKVGAHSQSVSVIRDGEVTLSATMNDPEPLTLAQLQERISSLTEGDWFIPPVGETD